MLSWTYIIGIIYEVGKQESYRYCEEVLAREHSRNGGCVYDYVSERCYFSEYAVYTISLLYLSL